MNPFLSLQDTKRNQEVATRLQNEMGAHFLEHAMYDVNDALASIMAICDVERVKSLPKIKTYIERINRHLNDVKLYQRKNIFNIDHVLRNVLNIIKDNFKEGVEIDYSSISAKIFAETNQNRLEYILLYLMIELLAVKDESSNPTQITVSLTQKDSEGQILIRRGCFSFSQPALQALDQLRGEFLGKMNLIHKNEGVEIDIRLPLSFKKNLFSMDSLAPELRITPKAHNKISVRV